MKKNLFLTFNLFFCYTIFSNTFIDTTIKLPKHFKVENTFSGNLPNNKSFHLVFSKNKKSKEYTVHSYLFNGENIEAVQPIKNNKAYSVISFHEQNNVLTLLLSFKKKRDNFLRKVNINLTTKEVVEGSIINHNDYITSFRENNRSVLIYKTDNKLLIKEYTGTENVNSSNYEFTSKKDVIKEYLKNSSLVPIKTNEFVSNGSTSNLKGYLNNTSITLTKENQSKNETKVLELNFNKNKLEVSKIKKFKNSNGNKKFKKSTSYINNNQLFQLGVSKKSGTIKISDISSEKNLNTISLDASLTSNIKGNTKFQGLEKFLKNAGKNKYNATITVNKTNHSKVRVRVDYVDITYNYHYNWWWHHQQFMMWQQQIHQQMIPNIPNGFGPRQPNDLFFKTATVKNEHRFFELLIDSSGLLSNEELPETTFKKIDKKEYIDKLEDIKDIKHASSCFLKDSFRYIGYSRALKGFVIQSNKIQQ